MKKFKSSASLLLVCLGLNSITSIFIYTFLLAHIINISSNSIINIAIFYLVLHISMILFSLILAPVFKRMNKTLILKFGIGIKFIFVLLVTIFSESIIKHIYLISVCNALSEVVFWAGANAIIPRATDNQSMQQFFSFQSIIGNIINLTIPSIIGAWIDSSGIKVISIIMIFVVAAQIIISLYIKNYMVEETTKLKFKEFKTAIKETNNKTVKPIYMNMVLLGVCSNIGTLVLYFTYITYQTNISLGIFSTVTSILTIIFLSIFNIKKSVFKKKVPFLVYIGVVALSLFFLMFEINKISLLIFTLAWNLGNAVPNTVASSQRLEIVQNKELVHYNVENMTISEVYLDAGRVVGEVVLLLMGVLTSFVFNIIVISCFIVAVVLHYLLTRYLVTKTEYTFT